MNEDDFLWECAFVESGSNSTQFLVPGYLDEPKNFLTSDKQGVPLSCVAFLPVKGQCNVEDVKLTISVVEIRGNGVLDTVGGEIWEASLLLCAYILLYPHLFIHNSVLELGSGLGLPGFLVAELQSLVHSSCVREVCLSDNDPRCVENLINLIRRRYVETMIGDHNTDMEDHKGETNEEIGFRNQLSVIDLDWSSYVTQSNAEDVSCISDGNSLAVNCQKKDSLELHNICTSNQRFQVLMGSALCYSPYHTCLADTVRHFLDGKCKEVVIIQIGDRAGFDLFLTRLTSFQIEYSIDEVSEVVYNTAQLICQSHSINVDSERSSSAFHNYDEGEVRIEKKFFFPSEVIHSAISRCRASIDEQLTVNSVCEMSCSTNDTESPGTASSPMTNNLIKTDRESFKLVRATLRALNP